MYTRFWYPCIILSCVVIPCFVAKPFSLNEAIAAEDRQKQSLQNTARPKLSSENPEKIPLNRALKLNPRKLKKLKITENILPRGKKILSSLKYRKTFQIRSPLKPKKLKYIQKARNKRKNQYIKRQIKDDEKILRKYVPLIKSLSLLFDNILDGDSDDSRENRKQKYRKYRNTGKRNSTAICTCTGDTKDDTQEPSQETIVPTTSVIETTTESVTAETAAATTDNTPSSDVSSLRRDTDVSLLLAGDTSSAGRNHTRLREGSSSSLHSSAERDIARYHRNSQHHTGSGKDQPGTENNEEDTDSDTRNGPSGDELGRRLRGDGNDAPSPVYREGFNEADLPAEDEDSSRHSIRGDFSESERENKLEVRRNETQSSELLQQPVREQRGSLSDDHVDNNAESLQSKESDQESDHSVRLNITNYQRLSIRNGPSTEEDQKASPTNAGMIPMLDLNNPVIFAQNSPQHKAPFVTIIDGYSVARDKNGANKLAEQSIRFHS